LFLQVLHGCAESSQTLFDQFRVKLDGADIFDTKVCYDFIEYLLKGQVSYSDHFPAIICPSVCL